MCQACPLPRRHFLKLPLAAAAGTLLTVANASGRTTTTAGPPSSTSEFASGKALQRLREGNARYASGQSQVRDFRPERERRAAGQRPFAAVLACADSRVAPEILFDQGLGDLFVVRVAGNVIQDDGLASLEYAVRFLGVSQIVVLGHSACGAVEAAISVDKTRAELPGALPGLIQRLLPAVREARRSGSADKLLERATMANVTLAIEALRSSPAILAPAMAAGQLEVNGGVYHIASGQVDFV